MACPYYCKVHLKEHPDWVHAYCEANAEGRLRVPTVFEETHYCLNELYRDCPVLRFKEKHGKPQGTHVAP